MKIRYNQNIILTIFRISAYLSGIMFNADGGKIVFSGILGDSDFIER